MAFGINLRKLRRKHKLSQKELADLLGFGTSTIAQYENNKREPNFERLRKIKEFFEVSYNYLIRFRT